MPDQETDFYVYAYVDPKKRGIFKYDDYEFDYEPFYIGKGRNDRYKQHLSSCYKLANRSYNSYFYRKIRKIKKEYNKNPEIIFLKKGVTEKEAFDLEINLIQLIGRKDIKKGSLCNLTDGGEGISNPPESVRIKKRDRFKELWRDSVYRNKMVEISKNKKISEGHRKKMLEGLRRTDQSCSEETKRKIAVANRGHSVSEECKKKLSQRFKGRIISEEVRRKISNSLRGRKLSEETKRKLSIASRSRIVTEETRERMSVASTGRKHSIEAKKKMSLSKSGRCLSEEQKIMISNRHRGEKKSEETRLKMKISAMARWRALKESSGKK